MRTYVLQRDQDESGVSGTGPVGMVCVFPNGQAVLQWSENTEAGVPSLSVFPTLADLEKVHGHGGKTRLVETTPAQQEASSFSESEVLQFPAEGLEDGFSEGVFGEGDDAVPFLDVQARLFTAGTHRGRTYTTDDLDEMVASFKPPATELSDWDVPIQLDHSASARDTQGHIRAVWRDGQDLMGTLRFVGQQAIQPVRERRYRKLSVGIQLTRPRRLKEVSVTPFPYVTQAAIFKQEEPMNEETKPAEELKKKKAAEETEGEKKEEMSQAKPATPPTPPPAPPAPVVEKEQMSDTFAKVKAEHEQRMAAIEAKFAEREAKLVEQERLQRFKELTHLTETFCEEGKSVPPMAPKELAFVQTLSDEQLAAYKELKALQPAVVDFSVRGVQTSAPNKEQMNEVDVQAFAEKYCPVGAVTNGAKK